MRIINILEIVNKIPIRLESFPIYEEQLSEEVIKYCEDLFKCMILMICKSPYEITEEKIDEYVSKKEFHGEEGHSIYIIYSEIN